MAAAVPWSDIPFPPPFCFLTIEVSSLCSLGGTESGPEFGFADSDSAFAIGEGRRGASVIKAPQANMPTSRLPMRNGSRRDQFESESRLEAERRMWGVGFMV